MNVAPAVVAMALVGALLGHGVVFAQGSADFGKYEYDTNCAVCHGMDGKGSGVLVSFLRKQPPDLTELSARNLGVFPLSRLYESIEGVTVGAHGTREMPIWGQHYNAQATEVDVRSPAEREVYVRTRLLALLEYLGRLQKP